ncbi:MAG: glycosyltransferase family 2 protein [Candidatus Omnitrophica bacterium]|nr:glycosyltransferase family 2 protein [Candidatus Omnitrophota bacterium]
MKISVVIPVFNESGTLEKVVERVQKIPLEIEILIVDDGSSDGTREKLAVLSKKPGIKVFYHEKNRGKGAALRTGFQEASGKFVIVQDADLEYDPTDYGKLLGPLEDGRADVVFGSRFLGGPHRVLFFWHFLGNKFLTLLSNALSNLNLSDMETGYKAFRREILTHLHLRANRFAFEPEFTMKVAKKGFRVYETPISYSGRDYSEGKKITWWDGVKAVFAIVWFRFFD